MVVLRRLRAPRERASIHLILIRAMRASTNLSRLPTNDTKEVGTLLVRAAVIGGMARGALGLEELCATVCLAVLRASGWSSFLSHVAARSFVG